MLYCSSRRATWHLLRHIDDYSWTSLNNYWTFATETEFVTKNQYLYPTTTSPIEVLRPHNGWSYITIPGTDISLFVFYIIFLNGFVLI